MWRWTGRPWAMAFFAIAVVALLSTARNLFDPFRAPGAPVVSSGAPDSAPAYVVRRAGQIAVVPPADLAMTDVYLGEAYYAYRSGNIGRPPGLSVRDLHDVIITGTGVPTDAATQANVRALYCDYLASLNVAYWGRVAATIRADAAPTSHVSFERLAWRAALFVSLLGLARSCAWIVGAVDRAMERARLKLKQRQEPTWICDHCGYDLRGLPAQHRCPECGQQFSRNV
ncbi:MAG: hypothetical protein AB7O77_08335 [Phycisphaerales bacterium]